MAESLWRERLTTLAESARERIGVEVVDRERLALLEARDREAGYLRRELDSLAWTALNYSGGRPQDLKPEERMKLVQKARVVWMKDPQAGAAVDLMNDFAFGRGIPKPKAADPLVQEIIDEAWDDPDNQETLTGYPAQLEMGIDLSLQANLFFLVFDDGDDGRVKLAMLNHDTVTGVVRDKGYRKRVLYYLADEPEEEEAEWDYVADQPMLAANRIQPEIKKKYYEHWRNVEQADDDYEKGLRDAKPRRPPAQKLGDGKVFHVAVNKTGEMAFGHPTFDRLIGWYNAYNRFMDARVDIMEASAAFVMKRKVKGSPNQLQKQATQALSRRSSLGLATDPVTGEEIQAGPKPASIINENEAVSYEDFNINTNAGNAQTDAQMIRAQTSAGTRFPQSYYGDPSNSNLATATSLELPVLKAVENRQEIIERIVRFFIDRVIEKAVDKGRIETELSDEERAKLAEKKKGDQAQQLPGQMPPSEPGPLSLGVQEAHEDAHVDEEMTERDLSYEFSMPNPLRRMLADLVTAVMNIARTFDPNNTNMELSRILLTQVLGEGLELEDPAGAVEKVFPEDYVDPAVAAAQAQMAAQDPAAQSPFGPFAPTTQGADGQQHGAANPYGAPMKSAPPISEAVWPRGRDGEHVPGRVLEEARRTIPPAVRAASSRRRELLERDFDGAFGLDDGGSNGHGGG